MNGPLERTVAIIGQGLIGAGLGARLRAAGLDVMHVSRRPRVGSLAADLTTTEGRRRLRALLAEHRPGSVVLVHGPMDIDWCAVHRAEAVAAHLRTAEIVAR